MRLTKELLKSGPEKLLTAASDAKTTLLKLKKECLRIGANLDLEKWHIIAPKDTSSMRPSVHMSYLNGGRTTAFHGGVKLPRDGTKSSEKRPTNAHLRV
jgi:hypothetical protein